MNKFDRYYTSKKLSVNKALIKKYGTYHCDRYNTYYGQVFDGRDFALITNSYSIIATDNISADYEKFDDSMNNKLIEFFNNFNNRDVYKYKDSISLDTIKNGMDEDEIYKFDSVYGVGYQQLKKIIAIIGCIKINILEKELFKGEKQPVIEVIGKNGCVGYLLPVRTY